MYNLYMLGGAVVLYFVINCILARFFKQVAYAKGFDDKCHAWAMVFWLGIFGCIYVCALPDLNVRTQNEAILKQLQETGDIISRNIVINPEQKLQETHQEVKGRVGDFVSDAKEFVGSIKDQLMDDNGEESGLMKKAAKVVGDLKDKAADAMAQTDTDQAEAAIEKAEQTVKEAVEAATETVEKATE